MICISRFSGEGWDRKSSYDKEMDESVQTDPLLEKAERIFPDGDFYLTKEESAMVEQVQQFVPEGGSRLECRRHGRYGLVCRK